MRLFTCSACGNLLYFENTSCTRCGTMLGFVPEALTLGVFTPAAAGLFSSSVSGQRYRMCRNYADYGACNWMVPADSPEAYCAACRLNRTVPALSVEGNMALWQTLEVEKRRLVYSLLRLALPIAPRHASDAALEFDLLADSEPTFSERGRVMTGHDNGLITLNIAEADPAVRLRLRDQMDEPYRTLLGHFRHESGHYYWDRLVRGGAWLDEFRRIFGDERIDYGQSLERYYVAGPAADWRKRFVSAYASSHPWEDWAETWAHYLHIVDTLETAYEFGLTIHSRAGRDDALDVAHDFDAYGQDSAEILVENWLPLSFMLNSLNRSMGQEAAYPFVLPPPALTKLGFVHTVIRGAATA